MNSAISLELFDTGLDTLCTFGRPIQGYYKVIIFPTLWRRWDALGRLHMMSPLSQGVTAVREDAHLLRLLCWMYRSCGSRDPIEMTERKDLVQIEKKQKCWPYDQEYREPLMAKKKEKSTLMSCLVAATHVYYIFSGVCTRRLQVYTFSTGCT